MRFADASGPDGPDNLRWAASAGRAGLARGRGVFVACGGRLLPARSVRKVDAASLVPFESLPEPCPPLPRPGEVIDDNVALLKAGPTARPSLPTGVSGLVLEGTCASHVPSRYHAALTALTENGTPVVLATRSRDAPAQPSPRTDRSVRATSARRRQRSFSWCHSAGMRGSLRSAHGGAPASGSQPEWPTPFRQQSTWCDPTQNVAPRSRWPRWRATRNRRHRKANVSGLSARSLCRTPACPRTI